MGGPPSYAVAVLHRREGPYLSACLERLLPQTRDAADVFVLASPGLMAAEGDTRVIAVDGGASEWKNRAFRETDADAVLFVSAFDYPAPGCVAALRNALVGREMLGTAGALLLTEAGWPRKSHLRRPSLRLDKALMRRVRWAVTPRRYRHMPPRIESIRLRRVPAVPMHCAMVRRRAWEDAGGFEGGYRFHHDDLLLAERAREKGWEVAIAPPARAFHVPPIQHRAVPVAMRLAYEESLRRFVRERHGNAYAGAFAAVRWGRALIGAGMWGVLSTLEGSEATARFALDRAILRHQPGKAQSEGCPPDAEETYRWEYAPWCWT